MRHSFRRSYRMGKELVSLVANLLGFSDSEARDEIHRAKEQQTY